MLSATMKSSAAETRAFIGSGTGASGSGFLFFLGGSFSRLQLEAQLDVEQDGLPAPGLGVQPDRTLPQCAIPVYGFK